MAQDPVHLQRPQRTVKWVIFTITLLVVLGGAFLYLSRNYKYTPAATGRVIHVLAYSSLIGPWSAGPSLQKAFESENPGVEIQWIDGGDSRALLQKLRTSLPSDPSAAGDFDVVIGLDQFAVQEARGIENWRAMAVAKINEVTNPDSAVPNTTGSAAPTEDPNFPWNSDLPQVDRQRLEWQSFDWAPLTLIFRQGEISPPRHLKDLATAPYKGQLVWVDPRTSSIGFQFLAWVTALGQDGSALNLLKSLIPSRHSIAPNWSGAYGLFKKKQAQLAFSYLTSPVYHWKNESDLSYQPAPLEDRLPYQVEYAAVPANCVNCADGETFVQFLKSAKAQTVLMNENFMLPIRSDVMKGTLYEKLPHPKLLDPGLFEKVDSRQILDLWNQLGT